MENENTEYTGVTIGEQIWMPKNLNVDTFRDTTPIREAKTNEEWMLAGLNKQPAWCYYDNNPENGDKYGKLYNWYAVNDPRGLAPDTWRIPNQEDITFFVEYLFGYDSKNEMLTSEVDLNKIIESKKNNFITSWDKFSVKAGGIRSVLGEEFNYLNFDSYIWLNNVKNSDDIGRAFVIDNILKNFSYAFIYSKSSGLSVRCIKE
jgi:uncharacterized protein (TIGR02145 family)